MLTPSEAKCRLTQIWGSITSQALGEPLRGLRNVWTLPYIFSQASSNLISINFWEETEVTFQNYSTVVMLYVVTIIKCSVLSCDFTPFIDTSVKLRFNQWAKFLQSLFEWWWMRFWLKFRLKIWTLRAALVSGRTGDIFSKHCRFVKISWTFVKYFKSKQLSKKPFNCHTFSFCFVKIN